ncbi:unnamed protein product [Diplocarpon coronariae]|uniref:Uncharacterized protein n=1 Tax=Diplocarpon coronariae TaxID=2795749 RepID=A0A218ZD23_9HELO|nr:hypothetical protein B2J93_7854 [Marssonina coronariae]
MYATWTPNPSTPAHDAEYMISPGPESNFNTTATDTVFCYRLGLKELNGSTSILVLIHCYPQTNFI